MAFEAIFSGAFPFFIMFTIIKITWSGELWVLVHLLIIVQLVGVLKGLFACFVKQDSVMIFMSLYSCLYVTSLLPSKLFAILTISIKSWGTSGRKNMLTNYSPLIPVSLWWLTIFGGIAYSAYVNNYLKEDEIFYLSVGGGTYIGYWSLMMILWKVLVQKHHETRVTIINDSMYGTESSWSNLPIPKAALSSHPVDIVDGVIGDKDQGMAILAELRNIEDPSLDSLVLNSKSPLSPRKTNARNSDSKKYKGERRKDEESNAILANLRDIEQGRLLSSPFPSEQNDIQCLIPTVSSPSHSQGLISPSASSAYSYENFMEDFRRSTPSSDFEPINI
jgi:hypothetical protein